MTPPCQFVQIKKNSEALRRQQIRQVKKSVTSQIPDVADGVSLVLFQLKYPKG